jgi:hypothetical protein
LFLNISKLKKPWKIIYSISTKKHDRKKQQKVAFNEIMLIYAIMK